MAQAASEVVRIANARGGEGFIAVSAEARKKFWLDRARTAAIAKHTNAFKINEDVVIPLERLGDYTDGIERINIELSIAQQAEARWMRSTLLRRDPTPSTSGGRQRGDARHGEDARGSAGRARALVAADACALVRTSLDRIDEPDILRALQSHERGRVVEARAQGARCKPPSPGGHVRGRSRGRNAA